MKGTVIFAPSEVKLGQDREKWTVASSCNWVTLSGVLAYVVLSGAREKDVEGTHASCLNVKTFYFKSNCEALSLGPSPPVDIPLVTGCGLYSF